MLMEPSGTRATEPAGDLLLKINLVGSEWDKGQPSELEREKRMKISVKMHAVREWSRWTQHNVNEIENMLHPNKGK